MRLRLDQISCRQRIFILRLKRTEKDQKVYSYSGDLEQEVKKAKSEYMEKETSQERVFLLWQYQRAKKAYEKYEQRIADLKGFIELAEAELKKQESGGNA